MEFGKSHQHRQLRKSLDSPVLLCEGAVVADRQYQRAWVSAGLQVRAFSRPDGKWLVKLPEDHPELWSRLIERVRSDLAAPLLINRPADLDAERGGMLQAAGFISARTEALWRIPLASMSVRPIHSNSHRLLPVDCCDLNRVVDLDNTIRRWLSVRSRRGAGPGGETGRQVQTGRRFQ